MINLAAVTLRSTREPAASNYESPLEEKIKRALLFKFFFFFFNVGTRSNTQALS